MMHNDLDIVQRKIREEAVVQPWVNALVLAYLPMMMKVIDFEHHHVVNHPLYQPNQEQDHCVHLQLVQSINVSLSFACCAA
jgi:hypothetical protein